jgi:hypothetical protein
MNQQLESMVQGLRETEASTRLRQYGPNAVPGAHPHLWRLSLGMTVVGKPPYAEQPV